MHPWAIDFRGRLEERTFHSNLLEDNPLGDPADRPIWIYLPPGYGEDPQRRYPVIYEIQGLTGQLDMWRNRASFRKTPLELYDELFASGDAPPCLLVFVDCWTSLGGGQFVDSPGTGRYQSYLCDEIVPWVDAEYGTLADRGRRALHGKSSGGYGAMVVPMMRPDVWGGLASHAGDALFENCFLPGFRDCARALRDDYGGSFDGFWKDFRARPAFSKDSDLCLLNTWCMAACYSTDEDGTVRLPFDTETGELDLDVWRRWLEHDPVRMARKKRDALRSMRAVYVDAGKRDQFFLDLGARAFVRELRAAGIEDFFFELFDATHSAIEYRYPLAVKYLAERLS